LAWLIAINFNRKVEEAWYCGGWAAGVRGRLAVGENWDSLNREVRAACGLDGQYRKNTENTDGGV
jgi:hypothetical protein